MKILQLNLLAFGPFTDLPLDLEAGNHGLHLIYGPNEAGKSSALRALRQLLYGIPERSADDFLHPARNLRIGAKVRHSDGSMLEFIRRKGRGNTLRGAVDDSALEPRELERFLGGADQDLFETMFGIDHKTLVDGGKQIVEGGGQLGQVLFAAGSGVADLREVQQKLQAEMEELFKPAGRNQKIPRAIQELRDAQNAAKHHFLSSDEWVRHDQAFRTAQETKDRLEEERRQKSREQNRLSRIQNALKPIAGRKKLVAEWEGFRDVVLLPDDFAERHRQALNDLLVAESQARQAQQARDQIDQQLHQVAVPEGLLEQAGSIEDLYRRLGEYQKDLKDRPQRDLQRKTLEHEAKEILRTLGKPTDLEQAELLRLRKDEPITIQNSGNQHQGLLANLENARQAIVGLRSRIERASQELERLEAPQDPAELRRVIRWTQQQGDLERKLADARAALRQAEKQALAELTRLPGWSDTLEALEKLAVPAAETVDRFENDFKDVKNRLETLTDRLREEETALQELDGQIQKLELQHEVPTEEDLHEARQQRGTGWRLVRKAWQEGQNAGPDLDAFVAVFDPARNLAEAYERSVEAADHVSDRLRREAERVARKVEMVINRQTRWNQRDNQARQLQDTQVELERVQQAWTALWQPLGIPPLPPREMRGWLRKQGELARQAQALRDQHDQVEHLRESVELQRTQLGAVLQRLGESPADADEALATLLERSQGVVDRFDTVERRREQLQQDIADREQELREADRQARQAEERLAEWNTQWAKGMARLGLEPDASPAAANVFLGSISQLFQKLHEADGFRRRIEGIDRDARQFTDDVQGMVQQVAPDLASLEPSRAVEELNRRLTRARTALQERQTLQKQRAKEAEKLGQAQDVLARAKVRLDAMCQEARCPAHEDLVRAEQRSTQRRHLEKDIRQIEEQLLALSAGASLDEFITEAAGVQPDDLGLEIQRLGEQVTHLEGEISRLDQTIGSERTELERMDGSAAAARATEEAEHLLAQLHADVPHYVTLRLAAAVLREGIERYREKNQAPVMSRAIKLFADLTVGSFEHLRIEVNEKGEAVLIGVRAGGKETVGVEGMSDGSCDQLYLALRLASLEVWLQTHEPIPFIVDDILLNFDDDRAAAALKALAGLSRHTQVIFFTHHQHLVDLARRRLEDGILFVHQLPDRLPRLMIAAQQA